MHLSDPIVSQIILGVAGLLGVLLHSRLRKPADFERAQLLSHLADEILAGVKLANPTATWPDLTRLVIQALAGSKSTPTNNAAAIEQAATAAVHRLQLRAGDAGE